MGRGGRKKGGGQGAARWKAVDFQKEIRQKYKEFAEEGGDTKEKQIKRIGKNRWARH